MKNRVIRFSIIYGVLLAGFSAFVLMDSFILPHRYEKVYAASGETGQDHTEAEKPSEDRAEEEKPVEGRTEGEKPAKPKMPPSESENAKHGPHPGMPPMGFDPESFSGNFAKKGPRPKMDNDNENTEIRKSSVEDKQLISGEGAKISLKTDRINGTDIHVADVELSSAESLMTAFAEDTYGRNITDATSDIAQENGAVLAINGDYYGSRPNGYVIRNGVLYRDTASEGSEDLVIYKDGSYEIINEDEVTADELMKKGAWQVFSFGPALVEDGKIAVGAGQEVGRAMHSNPRTAIGIIDENHYVFVVSDGRTDENEGLTLTELAEYMQSLGVDTAYNLDGGGSSTMVLEGCVVNEPTTNGWSIKERSVSDIVYVK